MINYIKIFQKNIQKILKERKLSQLEFAKLAGIGSATAHLLVHGDYNPSLSILNQISEALGVPLPILLADPDDLSSKAISLPNNVVQLSVILSKTRAFQVQQWHKETIAQIQKISKNKKNSIFPN